MKGVIYSRCWKGREPIDGVPTRCCEMEEIYDGAKIVGGGRVIHKCYWHRDVPDEELYAVHRQEGKALREARLALPEDEQERAVFAFDGEGRRRSVRRVG
jgi:hypothetical protein